MLPLGIVGPWQIVIIAFIIVLLFGGRKIPELMKGVGKGVKSFKEGMNEIEDQVNRPTIPPRKTPTTLPKKSSASWLQLMTQARCPSGTISRC